jgi:hypothetical protein
LPKIHTLLHISWGTCSRFPRSLLWSEYRCLLEDSAAARTDSTRPGPSACSLRTSVRSPPIGNGSAAKSAALMTRRLAFLKTAASIARSVGGCLWDMAKNYVTEVNSRRMKVRKRRPCELRGTVFGRMISTGSRRYSISPGKQLAIVQLDRDAALSVA